MPHYTISIHDLLTADRSKILNTDGIKLYMCICSLQKFKTKSISRLLKTLLLECPQKGKKCRQGYKINGVIYDPNIRLGAAGLFFFLFRNYRDTLNKAKRNKIRPVCTRLNGSIMFYSAFPCSFAGFR